MHPNGATCKDCVHWNRCKWLIGELNGTETYCDWEPSRFKPKEKCSLCNDMGGWFDGSGVLAEPVSCPKCNIKEGGKTA